MEHLTRLVTDDASYRNANFWSLMKTFLQRSHFSKLADDAIGASLDLVESLEAHGEPAPQADLQRLREHVHSIVLHHSDEHPGKRAGERIKQGIMESVSNCLLATDQLVRIQKVLYLQISRSTLQQTHCC